MTKAHNLFRWMRENKQLDQKDEDRDFVIKFYNLSDEEFDRAIKDIIPEHEGLLPEWD